MNKKGQIGVGMILMIAITLIVGVVLFQVVAQQVGSSTSTWTVANASLTGAAVNDTAQYLTDYRSISGVRIFNATNDVEVDSGNYTVANNIVDPTTGGLSVSITPSGLSVPNLGYDAGTWTIDGTAQPTTYIANAGARAVAGLIAIFFALAIAVVAISPTLRSELIGVFK